MSQPGLDVELAPSARASGSPAGCHSAPFCSHCPSRQSIPAFANVQSTRKPFVDHGRPCCTCGERLGSRAAGCRGTPPSCHGEWRGGACATPRHIHRSVPVGIESSGRPSRPTMCGAGRYSSVSNGPWPSTGMEFGERRRAAAERVEQGAEPEAFVWTRSACLGGWSVGVEVVTRLRLRPGSVVRPGHRGGPD